MTDETVHGAGGNGRGHGHPATVDTDDLERRWDDLEARLEQAADRQADINAGLTEINARLAALVDGSRR